LAFPAIAKRRGWQGVVVLKFELDASGQAINIVVEQSSGHELLDEAAIENAKASRFSTQATEASRKVTKTYKFTIKEE
jgi:protein TonB